MTVVIHDRHGIPGPDALSGQHGGQTGHALPELGIGEAPGFGLNDFLVRMILDGGLKQAFDQQLVGECRHEKSVIWGPLVMIAGPKNTGGRRERQPDACQVGRGIALPGAEHLSLINN